MGGEVYVGVYMVLVGRFVFDPTQKFVLVGFVTQPNPKLFATQPNPTPGCVQGWVVNFFIFFLILFIHNL